MVGMKAGVRYRRLGGVLLLGILWAITAPSAAADRLTSPNYILNGNTNSSFGGQGSSANYGLFGAGGEPIIGNGLGGSFTLAQGFVAQQVPSMQLTVQPGGLLRHLPLDETSGTAVGDVSSAAAYGQMNGTGLSFTTGKLDGAVTNAGSDANARIGLPGASVQPSSITLQTWVKPSTLGAWDCIICYSGGAGHDWGPWELYVDGSHAGAFYWSINRGTTHGITTSGSGDTYTTGQWYHVSATYDSATGRQALYVNGVKKAEATYGAAALNYTVANASNQIDFFNSAKWPGEGLVGAIDHVKVFNRALSDGEVATEYQAQNAGNAAGIGLGQIIPGTSKTALYDVIVRTDSAQYSVALSQDHALQKGATTIPAVAGTITTPATWTEGTTKGLGFTLINAPGIDSKWSAGAKYAAFPSAATTYYSRTDHASSDTIDVLESRVRLDVASSQPSGDYSNVITYTGTTLP